MLILCSFVRIGIVFWKSLILGFQFLIFDLSFELSQSHRQLLCSRLKEKLGTATYLNKSAWRRYRYVDLADLANDLLNFLRYYVRCFNSHTHTYIHTIQIQKSRQNTHTLFGVIRIFGMRRSQSFLFVGFEFVTTFCTHIIFANSTPLTDQTRSLLWTEDPLEYIFGLSLIWVNLLSLAGDCLGHHFGLVLIHKSSILRMFNICLDRL